MPDHDSTPSDPPTTPGEASQGNPKRGLYFTRKEQGPGLKKQSLSRVINPHLHEQEEIDHVAEAPAGTALPPPPSWDSDKTTGVSRFRRESLAQMQPEKTSAIYEGVNEFDEPEKLQRRLWLGLLLAGILLLTAFVFYIYSSTFDFGSGTPAAAAAPQKAQAATLPLPLPEKTTLTAAEAAGHVAQALEALGKFVAARNDVARQEWLPPGEPLPACLQGEGSVAALQGLVIDAAKARLLLLGGRPAALVPVTDQQGFRRTAALLAGADGRFDVDWRSFVTPETVSWQDFLARKDGAPSLFRVRLTRAASGALALDHPGGAASVPVQTAPGSRLAAEITEAFAHNPGQPLEADAYLAADAMGQVRLTGWITDKWRL